MSKSLKTLLVTLTATIALSTAAFAADKAPAAGTIIKRADLPAAVTASAKKASKFPGVPSCAVGRVLLEELPDWQEDNASHKCAKSTALYVCQSFGRLSVRCDSSGK